MNVKRLRIIRLWQQMFDKSEWVFDENQTVCPMYGREYAAFEKEQQAKMRKLIDRGNALKDKVTARQKSKPMST